MFIVHFYLLKLLLVSKARTRIVNTVFSFTVTEIQN